MEKVNCPRCGISVTMNKVPEDILEEEMLCNMCVEALENGVCVFVTDEDHETHPFGVEYYTLEELDGGFPLDVEWFETEEKRAEACKDLIIHSED